MNADTVKLNRSWNYKNVISPFFRLYLITEGNGLLSTPSQSMVLEEGYLYLIPSFTLFNQSCDNSLSQHYIHFLEECADGSSLFASNRKLFHCKVVSTDLQCLERIIDLNPGRDLRNADNPKVYEKSPVMQEFIGRNKMLSTAVRMETEGLIMQLLARFIGSVEFREVSLNAISSKIPEAVNYISTHLQEKLTVELLARRANLSSDHFSKLFYQQTDERPLSFIQRKRIERCQFLLLTTDYSLELIASETGFDQMSYFSKVFKNFTGCTPGTYRRLNAGYT